jgi:hypothetical protein
MDDSFNRPGVDSDYRGIGVEVPVSREDITENKADENNRFEEILTFHVSKAPGGHIMVTCDQVRGLFLATKDFDKSMQQILPALKLLANAGA